MAVNLTGPTNECEMSLRGCAFEAAVLEQNRRRSGAAKTIDYAIVITDLL